MGSLGCEWAAEEGGAAVQGGALRADSRLKRQATVAQRQRDEMKQQTGREEPTTKSAGCCARPSRVAAVALWRGPKATERSRGDLQFLRMDTA